MVNKGDQYVVMHNFMSGNQSTLYKNDLIEVCSIDAVNDTVEVVTLNYTIHKSGMGTIRITTQELLSFCKKISTSVAASLPPPVQTSPTGNNTGIGAAPSDNSSALYIYGGDLFSSYRLEDLIGNNVGGGVDGSGVSNIRPKCECGAHSVGIDKHSDYCPLH